MVHLPIPNIQYVYLFTALMLAASLFIIWLLYQLSKVHNKLREAELLLVRFSDIMSVEDEKRKVEEFRNSIIKETKILLSLYKEKKITYDKILSAIAIYDDRMAFAEMGMYEPIFEFHSSEEFKRLIIENREKQKEMISSKTAVYCPIKWTVDGSQSAGQVMTNKNIKLTLRAFNNECDAAVANVRWNNANSMERRIILAREKIDKINDSNKIFIADEFLDLKLSELKMTHEYKEKLKAEKDDKAEAVRLEKEEQRLLRDLEDAEKKEGQYLKLLARAKVEAEDMTGEKLREFGEKIKKLEEEVEAARSKAQRAKAMAEQTRSGYIYIISNIGSFGKDVIKIGMTRRLDPIDRIKELGDASVPFSFDVHAIIYSSDAPSLERALHVQFEGARINTQNNRKEFFNASLEEIEVTIKKLAPDAPFFKDIEAQEYRETLSRRQLILEGVDNNPYESFPSEL